MFVDPMDPLYASKFEAFEAGIRTGHEQVLRHIRQRLSALSVKAEQSGDVSAFCAVEECCADMRLLWEQYEAVHGVKFGDATSASYRESDMIAAINAAIEKSLNDVVEKAADDAAVLAREAVRARLGVIVCNLMSEYEVERDGKNLVIRVKNQV